MPWDDAGAVPAVLGDVHREGRGGGRRADGRDGRAAGAARAEVLRRAEPRERPDDDLHIGPLTRLRSPRDHHARPLARPPQVRHERQDSCHRRPQFAGPVAGHPPRESTGRQRKAVVELGAGTGPITARADEGRPAGTSASSSTSFCPNFARRCGRSSPASKWSRATPRRLTDMLAERGISQVDYILSGLPLTHFATGRPRRGHRPGGRLLGAGRRVPPAHDRPVALSRPLPPVLPRGVVSTRRLEPAAGRGVLLPRLDSARGAAAGRLACRGRCPSATISSPAPRRETAMSRPPVAPARFGPRPPARRLQQDRPQVPVPPRPPPAPGRQPREGTTTRSNSSPISKAPRRRSTAGPSRWPARWTRPGPGRDPDPARRPQGPDLRLARVHAPNRRRAPAKPPSWHFWNSRAKGRRPSPSTA